MGTIGKIYFAGAAIITLAVAVENGQAGLITAGSFIVLYAFCRAVDEC